MTIHANSTVAEVMARWPWAGAVFLRRGMACVGCAMAPFDTLGEVAGTYGLDPRRFVGEIERAAAADGRRSSGRESRPRRRAGAAKPIGHREQSRRPAPRKEGR
jgi:hybrid cluster-associated redox disulfide protein